MLDHPQRVGVSNTKVTTHRTKRDDNDEVDDRYNNLKKYVNRPEKAMERAVLEFLLRVLDEEFEPINHSSSFSLSRQREYMAQTSGNHGRADWGFVLPEACVTSRTSGGSFPEAIDLLSQMVHCDIDIFIYHGLTNRRENHIA